MADFRMIGKVVYQSAKFLRMPATSRDLYTQLMLETDDDGIVEAYKVRKMCGASDDDFNILLAKDFIRYLDKDEEVVFLPHWHDQNVIRADRKKDSPYAALLKQVAPDYVQAIETKKKQRKKRKASVDGQVSDKLPSVDGQMSAQDKLNKDKLIKDKLIKDKLNQVNLNKDKLNHNKLNNLNDLTDDDLIKIVTYYEKNIKMGALIDDEVATLLNYCLLAGKALVSYGLQIIALKNGSQRSLSYLGGILKNWSAAGFTTVDQVKAEDEARHAALVDTHQSSASPEFLQAFEEWEV